MRLFFSAGEASGDAYGAALLREIRKLVPGEMHVQALGGARLRAQGADLVADASHWGAIGVAQAVRVAPRVRRGYRRALLALQAGAPGLFLPIDFGYINVRLARQAKRLGWKVLYFVPPGSWRRDRQGGDLPQIADEIVTPFPWSADILGQMGASVHWFGHPIKQLILEGIGPGPAPTRQEELLAVLPGSRRHEIERNLPVIAGCLAPLEAQTYPLRLEFSVASSLEPDVVRNAWLRLKPKRTEDVFTRGDNYGILRRARAGIVCSGTATLEAALCRCPMVVVYRITRGMALEGMLMGMAGKHVGLPNILMRREVVPELVHRALTPGRLAEMTARLLKDEEFRRKQLSSFEALDTLLGPGDAITKTAELAKKMLESFDPPQSDRA
jgi:lipid-A-disaccharide synthase